MKTKPYSILSFFSGVMMLLTLLWFSVGTCFVYLEEVQEEMDDKIVAQHDVPEDPDENACPFDDTEDSPETCNKNLSTEFLPERFEPQLNSTIFLRQYKGGYNAAFISFYAESFSPPPDPLS